MQLIDQHLPWKEFFLEHGMELLPKFFKCTHFGEKVENSVSNVDVREFLKSG